MLKLCRAKRTSVDFSNEGYGRVEPGDIVEIHCPTADELINRGLFEEVIIPKEAVYVPYTVNTPKIETKKKGRPKGKS